MQNIITRETGNFKLRKPEIIGISLLGAAFLGVTVAKAGFTVASGLAALPFILIYVVMIFRNPILGYYTAIIFGFTLLGLSRYVRGVPMGIFIDAMLVLTLIAIIFRRFPERADFKPLNKDIMFLATIWLLYGLMEFANPMMTSVPAFIQGFRGLILKTFLCVPLTLWLLDTQDRVKTFFYIWGIISLMASIKGGIQDNIGVDPWEQGWLDRGGDVTHVLFGKLRIFSFYSDAGQFGANQAYTAVLFSIMSLKTATKRDKIFFIIVALAGFYGMFISGTRGSMGVIGGFAMYFIHKKNIPILITGFIMAMSVFVFFRYTTIGNEVYAIKRMRSAFDPNDASLQVRLANQKRLSSYMATRPLGGSLGHGGVKAREFLPNAYLSNVATDSWYVLIWVEMGAIGLSMHLFILFYTLIKGSQIIMFKIRDQVLWHQMSGLASGLLGIMVANYGNAVMGSHPTALVSYTSLALLLNAAVIDKGIRKNLRNKTMKIKFLIRKNSTE